MKIAFLTGHTPSVYRFRLDCMKYLREWRAEVIVLGPEPEEEWKAVFAKDGIQYYQVKLNKNSTNPFTDLATYFDLRRQLCELKPKAVICDHAKMMIYGTLAAKHVHIPYRFIMLGGVGSVLRDPPESFKRKLIQDIVKLEYRVAFPRANKIFFQNNDDLRLFLDMKIAARKQAVMIPGSGVNLKQYPVSPLPDNHDFLFVGRLIRDKGLMEFLEAGRKLRRRVPDAKCHVVGYFDPNQTMLSMADIQPYIDDGTVIYHGQQDDVLPYLQSCYGFVLPSYHEGTPHSVLEALSVGRPVVTTRAPGCRETVVEGKNGFLVPVKAVGALSDAMEKLCKNREMAEAMAIESRRLAETRFDVNIVCDTLYRTIYSYLER